MTLASQSHFLWLLPLTGCPDLSGEDTHFQTYNVIMSGSDRLLAPYQPDSYWCQSVSTITESGNFEAILGPRDKI